MMNVRVCGLAYGSRYWLGIRAFATAAFCGIFPVAAIAAQAAGNAVKVRPNASVSNPEGTITLNVGMDVAMGDRIVTDRKGEVQLVFTDETKLVVGPNSSLVIEAYLLRSKSRANNFTVRALGGSFRMITGKSKKKAYKIKTPTATIGVRGTSFDFTVQPNETGLVLFNGQAEICRVDGKCSVVDSRCSIAVVRNNRDPSVLRGKEDRRAQIRQNFPYVISQRRLRRDFRIRRTGCRDVARAPRALTGDRDRDSREPAERDGPRDNGNGLPN